MAMGRPRPSTIAWILVMRPAARAANCLRFRPLFRPPPSGGLGGTVDGLTIASIIARQRFKQPTPNAASGPRPRALDGGAARVLELA